VYEEESFVNSRGSQAKASQSTANGNTDGAGSDVDADKSEDELPSTPRGAPRCYMCKKPNPQ
jgi:hypothetical protein